MKNCVVTLFVITLLLSVTSVRANQPDFNENFTSLTYKWYFVSDELSTYQGLNKYCKDPEFQYEVKNVLREIHKYDSALYAKVTSLMAESPSRELKKTLKKIGHLEQKVNALMLSNLLKSECHNQRQLAREYRKVKNDFGAYSYDNQIVVTEVYLKKHVSKINDIMENIEDHFHHLEGQ